MLSREPFPGCRHEEEDERNKLTSRLSDVESSYHNQRLEYQSVHARCGCSHGTLSYTHPLSAGTQHPYQSSAAPLSSRACVTCLLTLGQVHSPAEGCYARRVTGRCAELEGALAAAQRKLDERDQALESRESLIADAAAKAALLQEQLQQEQAKLAELQTDRAARIAGLEVRPVHPGHSAGPG